MAALLDERAARALAEAVPVAYFAQEWEAVLADAEHAQLADDARVALAHHMGYGRQKAVLHSAPMHGFGPTFSLCARARSTCKRFRLRACRHVRTQWLFD